MKKVLIVLFIITCSISGITAISSGLFLIWSDNESLCNLAVKICFTCVISTLIHIAAIRALDDLTT